MQGALLAALAAGQWAEQDTELLRTDGPPTRIAPRSDGTIHGDIERKVVGQFDELGYLSMTGDELTARNDVSPWRVMFSSALRHAVAAVNASEARRRS